MRRTWSMIALAAALTMTGGMLTSTVPARAEPADPPAGVGAGRTMLVLDASGSMAEPAGGGRTKIEAAKSALTTVVDGLPAEAAVGFRVFGAEVFSLDDPGACEDSQQIVAPGTDNRGELQAAVEDYEPYGETPIPHALEQAAEDLGDEGPRSIVLVSDGESNCEPDPCEVAAELVEQGIELTIDVVGLSVSGEAREQLSCIAENGGGTYYDAEDADDIEASLERASERAVRPFTIDGTPVEGGPEESPTAIELGDHVDRFDVGRDVEKFYAVEKTEPGTTLRVSAFSQGGRGTSQGLALVLEGPEGGQCEADNYLRDLDDRGVIATSVRTEVTDEECSAPGTYLIGLRARFEQIGAPVGIRITEEPEVTDEGFAESGPVEVAAPEVFGDPEEVVAGTSFDNAAEIGPGRWRSDVVPGEAGLFRVPLEFGQSLRYRVEYDEVPGVSDGRGSGVRAGVVAYNPMQSILAPPGEADDFVIEQGDGIVLRSATAPVGRGDPELGRSRSGVTDFTMAGDYYLSVSMGRAEETVIRPFVLDVEVVGEPAEGPTYADGATWSVADGTSGGPAAEAEPPDPESPAAEPDDPEPAPSPDGPGEPPSEGGSEAGDGSWLAPALGVTAGLAGLAALAGAFLLWRRRRGPG